MSNLKQEKCPYCKGTGRIKWSLQLPCVRLKQLREQRGETQETFAGNVGISRTQVVNMEAGRTVGSIELLIRIADHYEVSVDWILGRET